MASATLSAASDAEQPLSVSDAQDAPHPQHIAGRLLDESSRLADAYRSMTVHWRAAPYPPLADGRLATLRGKIADGRLATLRGKIADGHLHDAVLVAWDEDVRGGGAEPSDWRRLAGAGSQRLRQRAAIIATVRGFFEARDYLEVETPLLVTSPGLDVHLDAFAVGSGGSGESGVAGRERYLSTSPEYHMKRLLSCGMPRIFQLARCFRRAESGRRHNQEFTMLEWYTAHASVEQMMAQTEALVRAVFQQHHASQGREVAGGCDVQQTFARVSMSEAFERYAATSAAHMQRLANEDEERFFRLLIERVEPALARLGHPVFLYDYPACQASLARLRPQAPEVAERFELYLGDWELCNGFGELTNAAEQRTRLLADQQTRRQQQKPIYPIDERFLAALAAGMPNAAGNALGIDRLVALCLDCDNIDAVMPFSDQQP